MLRPSAVQVRRRQLIWGARRGPAARAAALRADAKLALWRLATLAQRESRNESPDLGTLTGLLETASFRLELYCDYLGRELEPRLCALGEFGAVVASSFKPFERRQALELAQLAEHLERAPRSHGVAQRVFVTAVMLVGELDAHGRDVAGAMSKRPAADAAASS
jgi:hypothetical protein